MSCHPRVIEWTDTIQTHLPHLSKPQATVLALWSLGMVLARSCALTAVSAFLATWLGRKEPAVRQQLREFCYEATAKRGTARCALAVEPCFEPLLAWVVEQWEGTQLALALDATTLGTRFTVLVISVVYRGCAIPVAWTVLPATAKHAWRREWLRLLRQVHRAVPRAWTVLVLADRGLYALWLAVAVATLWLPSVGGEAEETMPASTVPDVTALVPRQPRMRHATRLRWVRVFRRGWNLILVALLEQAPLPIGRFVPEPWPVVAALEEQAALLPGP